MTPEAIDHPRVFPPAIVLEKSEREAVHIIDELDTPDKNILLADDDVPETNRPSEEITLLKEKQHSSATNLIDDEPLPGIAVTQQKSVATPEGISKKNSSLVGRAREFLMLEKGYIPDEELENFELDFAEEVFSVDGPVTEKVDQALIRNFKYKPIHDTATVSPGQTQREELFLVEDLDQKSLAVA